MKNRILPIIKRRLGGAKPRPIKPTFEEYEERYTLNQIQSLEALLQRNNRSLRDFRSVLEFGCGFGRMLTHMTRLMSQAKFSGCEAVIHNVEYCQRKFPSINFCQTGATPPSSFADEEFDLIYSYSVFTHLSEENHIAWLGEMARLLKPGGVMLHSTKSYEFVRRANFFSPESLVKYGIEPPFDKFEEKNPYYYVVNIPSRPEYGLTIISKEYVLANWATYAKAESVDYFEGGIEAHPEGCHDLVFIAREA